MVNRRELESLVDGYVKTYMVNKHLTKEQIEKVIDKVEDSKGSPMELLEEIRNAVQEVHLHG